MGDTSFGKYRLIAELGHGGMADVFLAVQAGPLGSGFRKLTVVKRLRPNLAEEPEFIAMLVDEARIAARLNHPNVVQTNEVGQVGAVYFIAMEYLDGQPLHRIQHRAAQRARDGTGSIFTKEQHYLVICDTLAGLHHAHQLADYDGTALHIVHRDMTPHNIFVTYEGQTKVVDFGIAKAVGRSSETRQGVVKGKVRYMAPEQAVGQYVDRRADLFSVGVMIWEIATGRRMWKDMDDLAIVQALVMGNLPPSPKEIDPTVPDAIDAICRKALAPDMKNRYANAEDLRMDLEQYLADAGKLVEARRRIGHTISELFKDKRTEIKEVIERQLLALDEKASAEFEAVPIQVETQSSPTPVSVSVDDGAVANVDDHSSTELYERRRGGFGRQVGIVVSIAAIAAVSVLLLTFRTRNGEAAKPAPTVAPQLTSAAPAIEEVELKLSATAPNARVSIDDGPLQLLPLELPVRKDKKEHSLRIEADGFVTKTDWVRFNRDLNNSYQLAPAAVATARPTQPAYVPPTSYRPPGPATAPATRDPQTPTVAPTVPSAAPAHTGKPGLSITHGAVGRSGREKVAERGPAWDGGWPPRRRLWPRRVEGRATKRRGDRVVPATYERGM